MLYIDAWIFPGTPRKKPSASKIELDVYLPVRGTDSVAEPVFFSPALAPINMYRYVTGRLTNILNKTSPSSLEQMGLFLPLNKGRECP